MSDPYASAVNAVPDRAAPSYRKPMPKIDAWNRPFWEATRNGVFIAQRDTVGNVWFPPSPMSPFTHSDLWEWVPLSGRGKVVSWVRFHQKYFAGFEAELPYNVATVQLDEGPLVYTNLVDVDADSIAIGARVVVRFLEMDGTFQLPVFAPEVVA